MYSTRASIRLRACTITRATYASRSSSTSAGYSPTSSAGVSSAEVQSAKAYCLNLLKTYDSPSYTLLPFVPPASQSAYLAIRAFNIEIARIADTTSTSIVATMRLQFWRDNITRAFAGEPPKQPVSLLLAHALDDLSSRTNGTARMSKQWFMRVLSAREQYLDNRSYTSLDALEQYAESTYSTLLYLTLSALPLSSITADHLASHVGKAAGITAVLRGLPLIAFPPPPNHHSNSATLGGGQIQIQRERHGAVILPLDVMADAGVRQEDVLRHGAEAPGLRDAVFTVATRASDHLITAREMLKNLRAGLAVGHEFEHEGEDGHIYDGQSSSGSGSGSEGGKGRGTAAQLAEVEKEAFGVLMPAVSTRLWLDRLQKCDFDVFREELRRREWKLPWKAYLAYGRKMF